MIESNFSPKIVNCTDFHSYFQKVFGDYSRCQSVRSLQFYRRNFRSRLAASAAKQFTQDPSRGVPFPALPLSGLEKLREGIPRHLNLMN